MSKAETTGKVIVEFANEPLLEDLQLPELLKEYKHFVDKKDEYAKKATAVSATIKTIVETVKADTVLYTDARGGEWRSTLVRPEAGTKTDLDLLRDGMMKIGKLDAVTVAKIFAKAEVPTEPRESYVRITLPKVKGVRQ